jgi:organizing structure protein 2
LPDQTKIYLSSIVCTHNIRHLTDRIKSIISPDEPLTPGALYVGVATLSGSIFARNRNLPTRLLLPPIFLMASAQHFLPKTTHNFSAYLGSLEDKYFPTVSQKHEIAKAHSAMTWQRVKEATQGNRTRLEKVASSAVDQVQKVTGLKIRESFGRGKARIDGVAAKVESGEKTQLLEQLKMGDKDSQGEEKKLD